VIHRSKRDDQVQREMNLQLSNVLTQARATAPRVLREVPYLRWLVLGYVVLLVGSLPVNLPEGLRLSIFLAGCACGLISMRFARPARRLSVPRAQK